MDHPFPPDCVARFRPERPIASGGFGAVWLATHIQLGRQVALKVLLARAMGDAEQVARFINEGRITARLEHPNIVAVHDLGVSQGVPWIAYEYIPGPTLRQQLGLQRPSVAAAIGATLQVASALEKAHAHGVLHRDIKPENVLEAEPSRYKVTDFGIARWSGQSEVHTKTGVILGTPSYLPPELIQGDPVSPRSDLYSLGIMLFELLTGQPPFQGASLAEVIQHHLQTPVPRPSTVRPGIPPILDDVLLRVLSKQPDQRHGSAAEFCEALAAALPQSASPVSSGAWATGRTRPVVTQAATIGAGAAKADEATLTPGGPAAAAVEVSTLAPARLLVRTQARPAPVPKRTGGTASRPRVRVLSKAPVSTPPARRGWRLLLAAAACVGALAVVGIAQHARRPVVPAVVPTPAGVAQSRLPDVEDRLQMLDRRIRVATVVVRKALEEVEQAEKRLLSGTNTSARRGVIQELKIKSKPAREEFQELVAAIVRLGPDVIAAGRVPHLEAGFLWAVNDLVGCKAMRDHYAEEQKKLVDALTSWRAKGEQRWLTHALLACTYSQSKNRREKLDGREAAREARKRLAATHGSDPEDANAMAAQFMLWRFEDDTLDRRSEDGRSRHESIRKDLARITADRRAAKRTSPLFDAVSSWLKDL